MAAEHDVAAPRRTPATPPPQAVMGLLNYITATSLDEDYALVSRRRRTDREDATAAGVGHRRPGVAGLAVLAAFGVLVATAAVQTARNAEESASSRESLVDQVNGRRATLDAERTRLTELQQSVASLRSIDLDATARGRAVQGRLTDLGVAAGTVPVTGDGIKVVVDDAPGATTDGERVHARDLQRLVNALWQVGAEAIAVNGHRLTSLSAIRDAGDSIGVNFFSLRAPYTLLAVGNRRSMGGRLLDTDGGRTWATLQSSFGLQFDVTTEESMELPAARTPTLRFAHRPERLR
jgi:uncharacterized protein YlxW (UPF0749 family)